VPLAIRPLFFGANLIAFRKKDGGLRPIAIGIVLRRLVARAACAATQQQAADLLAPTQLGLCIRGGAEAAVHGVRRFLDAAMGESGIVKLDFANAFNTVSRSSVVSAVSTYLPQLDRFTRCAYGTASMLLFGDFTSSSACAINRETHLAPCFFLLRFGTFPTPDDATSTSGIWTMRPLAGHQNRSWRRSSASNFRPRPQIYKMRSNFFEFRLCGQCEVSTSWLPLYRPK